MLRKLVFVSCGQETDAETALGHRICAAIDSLPHTKSFYAERVHSPNDLNREVFTALNRCDAFVAVMHDRGAVSYGTYADAHRASVWIQQEIAIIAFRMFLQQRYIPIRVYAQTNLLLEGVMRTAIVNPLPFTTDDEILNDINQWFEGHDFDEHPVTARRATLFAARTDPLGEIEWFVLELLAAHTIKPGESVVQGAIRDDFYDHYRRAGQPDPVIETNLSNAVASLRSLHLVSVGVDDRRGSLLQISAQWWDLTLDALYARGRL